MDFSTPDMSHVLDHGKEIHNPIYLTKKTIQKYLKKIKKVFQKKHKENSSKF
jgi:hypothetical protein